MLEVPRNEFSHILVISHISVTSMMNSKHSKMKFFLYSHIYCAAVMGVKKQQHQFSC